MLDAEEFAGWLRLLETPDLGRAAARRLLAAFGSPAAALGADADSWRRVAGAVPVEPPRFAERLAAARRWLDDSAGAARRGCIALGDPEYPPQLLQTADPPLLLYLQGDAGLLGAPSIAIVGSRNPTAQGADSARRFGRALSERGFLVVSGLAAGIDGAAHEGALGAGAPTVAVVGTGLDIVYPSAHRDLARRIEAQGLLVSEYAPGMPPLGANFPQRNRIIAGLTLGTLVVEAALRSGSLITARLAAEAGREVFALPGSIHAPQSRGCHALIKQGAQLVESADEIADALRGVRQDAPPAVSVEAPSAPADAVLEALGDDPATLDALLARTGWSTPDLSAHLLNLELDGQVARLPGGLYQRRHAG